MADDLDKRKDSEQPDWGEEPQRRESEDGTIIEIFDSIDEFFRICDRRERNSWCSERSSARNKSYSGDSDFCNQKYEETRDEAIHGNDETAAELGQKIIDADKLFGWDKKPTKKAKLDVIGSHPSVPRALMNLPKSMYHREVGITKGKVINIVYDISVNCGISVEQQKKKGAEVVSVLKQLEDLGYRVRLDIMGAFTSSRVTYGCRVKVKSEWNALNLKRIGALCMNANVQRRLWFDWYERCPGARELSGYGYPLMNERDAREKFKKEFCASNEYFVTYGDDLKELFKEQLSLDKIDKDDRGR